MESRRNLASMCLLQVYWHGREVVPEACTGCFSPGPWEMGRYGLCSFKILETDLNHLVRSSNLSQQLSSTECHAKRWIKLGLAVECWTLVLTTVSAFVDVWQWMCSHFLAHLPTFRFTQPSLSHTIASWPWISPMVAIFLMDTKYVPSCLYAVSTWVSNFFLLGHTFVEVSRCECLSSSYKVNAGSLLFCTCNRRTPKKSHLFLSSSRPCPTDWMRPQSSLTMIRFLNCLLCQFLPSVFLPWWHLHLGIGFKWEVENKESILWHFTLHSLYILGAMGKGQQIPSTIAIFC